MIRKCVLYGSHPFVSNLTERQRRTVFRIRTYSLNLDPDPDPGIFFNPDPDLDRFLILIQFFDHKLSYVSS